jgi:hypothetical protein
MAGCDRRTPPAPTSATPPAPSTGAVSPPNAGTGAGRTSPAQDDASVAPSLLLLSSDWAKDPELSGRQPTEDLARCPKAPPGLAPSNAPLVPPPFLRFEAIATHACDAVLRVFLGCLEATDDGSTCRHWRERLVLEPVGGAAAASVIGDLDPVIGGNAGGLFVPFAFARDDQRILLRAWMFSPGAGGGAVDYGVGLLARSAPKSPAPQALEVLSFPARDPSFYGDFGCAIGLGASELTPTYSQPGFPSNNGGALLAVDLATLKTRALAKEKDTTYAVKRLDEKARTIEVEVAKHAFGQECPREEGALGCSTSTTSRRTIPLPPCGTERR